MCFSRADTWKYQHKNFSTLIQDQCKILGLKCSPSDPRRCLVRTSYILFCYSTTVLSLYTQFPSYSQEDLVKVLICTLKVELSPFLFSSFNMRPNSAQELNFKTFKLMSNRPTFLQTTDLFVQEGVYLLASFTSILLTYLLEDSSTNFPFQSSRHRNLRLKPEYILATSVPHGPEDALPVC